MSSRGPSRKCRLSPRVLLGHNMFVWLNFKKTSSWYLKSRGFIQISGYPFLFLFFFFFLFFSFFFLNQAMSHSTLGQIVTVRCPRHFCLRGPPPQGNPAGSAGTGVAARLTPRTPRAGIPSAWFFVGKTLTQVSCDLSRSLRHVRSSDSAGRYVVGALPPANGGEGQGPRVVLRPLRGGARRATLAKPGDTA